MEEQMGDRLKDRVAVVTGSGRGIGRAIVLAMAKEGARVVTNDIDPAVAELVAKEIIDSGGQAASFSGDISKFDKARKLIRTAVDNFGRIDILVNNAGVLGTGLPWDLKEKAWDFVQGVHMKGSFNCIRHASGLMKEQRWGRIINVTSRVRLGTVANFNYCSAKAGIVGLTRAVARDVGRYGITCNAYDPGAKTRMMTAFARSRPIKRAYEAGLIIPQGRLKGSAKMAGPEAVAPLVVYLATDEAADINGQVFAISGGQVGIYTEPTLNKVVIKESGPWTVEELIGMVPRVLLEGYTNPAPAQPAK
jgi:NAD(P)-dependent dehydrogenase (short-subunit alcohol dehydrogenase family)